MKAVEKVCGNCRFFCTNRVTPETGYCPKVSNGPVARGSGEACNVKVEIEAFEPKRSKPRATTKKRSKKEQPTEKPEGAATE